MNKLSKEENPGIAYIIFKDEEGELLRNGHVMLKNRYGSHVNAGDLILLNSNRRYIAKIDKKLDLGNVTHFDLEVTLIKEIEQIPAHD